MKKLTEEFIKQLPEELQQKARECKTKEDLHRFIEDNSLELPDEALELVSGGCTSDNNKKEYYCKKHGTKVQTATTYMGITYYCKECGRALTYGEYESR